jgi:putative ABC transport system permease protein
VGASKAQIRKLVRREAFLLLIRALPFGILLGIAATVFCCALLKYYNSYLFAEIPLFTLSLTGIMAGAAVGILTVAAASVMPARKAARVSPVNAVSGSNDFKVPKSKKRGVLTRIFSAETAMGVGNAVMKKKTLLLMAFSIAISIAMFLGFNVLVDFMHTSLKTTKSYTPDISLVSEQGLRPDLYAQIAGLEGVKHVCSRMFDHVDATFDAARLTENYKQQISEQKGRSSFGKRPV